MKRRAPCREEPCVVRVRVMCESMKVQNNSHGEAKYQC